MLEPASDLEAQARISKDSLPAMDGWTLAWILLEFWIR
tara:strand:- start:812 stop:925 length:114 start_codon:yes stop_codon:yes gene_type:complete